MAAKVVTTLLVSDGSDSITVGLREDVARESPDGFAEIVFNDGSGRVYLTADDVEQLSTFLNTL